MTSQRKKTPRLASGDTTLIKRRRRGRPKGSAYPIRKIARLSILSDTLLIYLYAKNQGSGDYSSIIREAIDQYAVNHPAFERSEFMTLLSSVAGSLSGPEDIHRLINEAARIFQATASDISREIGIELPLQRTARDDK